MFLYKHCGYYHLQYKNDAGKWVRKTTKKTTLVEAERWRDIFVKQLLPEPQILTVSLQNNSSGYTYQELMGKIENHVRTNLSPNSANIVLKVLYEFEKIVGHLRLDDINEEHVEQYKQIRKGEIELATVNRDITTLRTIFNLAIRWKLCRDNPAQYISKLKTLQKEIMIFEPEHIDSMIDIMKNDDCPHFIYITKLALYTGMRLNEILHLQWQDIDIKNRKVIIRNKANFKTKTGKIRQIPISAKFLELLDDMRPINYNPEALLFPNTWHRAYTKSYISRRFGKYVRLAGLSRQYHFHCLRHTALSTMVKAGVPITHVQRIAGHSNIKTTLIYVHLNVEDLRSAVENINF